MSIIKKREIDRMQENGSAPRKYKDNDLIQALGNATRGGDSSGKDG